MKQPSINNARFYVCSLFFHTKLLLEIILQIIIFGMVVYARDNRYIQTCDIPAVNTDCKSTPTTPYSPPTPI